VKKTLSFSFNPTREGIEARLGEMEMKIDRLRSMYESYFMGTERMPPNALRREMNRMMLEMQQVPIGNASLRFRFQALSQKWVLHMTYWNRTFREIEAGTYRRDLARAQRHLSQRGGILSEEEAIAIGIPKNRVKAFVARQQRQESKRVSGESAPAENLAGAKTQDPAAAGAPAPHLGSAPPPIPAHARRSPPPDGAAPGPTLPGLSEPDFQGAYERYLAAHRELGTVGEAASRERIRARLNRQLPRILAEQQCERVHIEVTVEEGKVRLRAWPAEPKPSR
jgi:hypothetical protein